MPPTSPVRPGIPDIFSALPVATFLVAPDNIIMEANSRAEALLNMARTAIVGSDIARTVRIEEANPRFQLWQSDKPVAAYDIALHAGRNAGIKADVMIAPLGEHEGWRVVTVHTQSLAQAIGGRRTSGGGRSAMGAAAILAHEIKNPLSGIRGAAQLLSNGGNEGDDALTRLICDEVDRIAALIDRMQDFTTERPLDCVPTNIYPVLDRAIQIASAGFASSTQIIRKYDPSLPSALCNPDALAQIVINLLKNASEAASGQNKQVLRIETAFRHGVSVMLGEGKGNAILPIEIVVSDNGPGVPAHIRDDLFNPFISTKRDGQGLGLALVDKLVRDMNGFVQHSRDEVAGETVFRILLPMAML
ncbi:MAG: two-component sensor histidine kinase [Sphingobium sp.]|nr:two-component sensor histidine kinase [Sphingobium sp.]MBP6112369.1 two-component sensor histidine kinase [Sphingobium sp.]MBP8671814.1 two-component sensor histidine kinase [Sphingobium sp.]MBP9156165.1 two-component sensor histidine kinase [Sphingobium sp.]MCC6481833.1 two-component sensor histidine kinase [Sphingomonadaceae bacterium]